MFGLARLADRVEVLAAELTGQRRRCAILERRVDKLEKAEGKPEPERSGGRQPGERGSPTLAQWWHDQ